jgi:hypothetical protein
MCPGNDQRVAGRRRLKREEGSPALVLTDDLDGSILASRDRAEGTGLAFGRCRRHLPASFAAFSIQFPTFS